MATDCIYNIDIKTNNKDIISVSSDEFDHFYLANIDDDGEEIKYEKIENNSLYANFFMIRLLDNGESTSIINRLFKEKDIISIGLNFTNGKYQEFSLAKKRILNSGHLENHYETTFKLENNLCILVSDKQIKYAEYLFY